MAVALANASTLIGKLAGEGRRLPNPHVLIRPFVRREAVFSSRIEGTQPARPAFGPKKSSSRGEKKLDDQLQVLSRAARDHGISLSDERTNWTKLRRAKVPHIATKFE